MKFYNKVILSALVFIPSISLAELSGNIGYVSDYVYRGIYQEESSASFGVDYESEAGLYVGTWMADVADGIESDFYAGFSGSSGDFNYGLGVTGYYYSDGWDNAYEEANLSLGYGFITLDYADGKYKAPTETSYTVTSITIDTPVGLYITSGSFGADSSGDWTEIGYGVELDSGVGMSIALINSDNLGVTQDNSSAVHINNSAINTTPSNQLVFGVSYGFGL